jgi:hypothetical protein
MSLDERDLNQDETKPSPQPPQTTAHMHPLVRLLMRHRTTKTRHALIAGSWLLVLIALYITVKIMER